jgi:hypothetical protein
MAINNAVIANELTCHRGGVRIKTIALPAEHGGWGLLFEPIAFGLLLAPSIAGVYLALCAVGLFLARQPLTLLMLNLRRASPRTTIAIRFAALYIVIGTASLIAAFSFSQHSFILPLLIAAPLATVQLAHDWSGRRRVLLSEISGAIAISSIAPAITLSGGWSSPESFALWAIMTARVVPAIIYVRSCLRRSHRGAVSSVPMLVAHTVAVAGAVILVHAALAPRLLIVAMGMLLIRAAVAFAKVEHLTAKRLGFMEIGFGVLTVTAVLFGHWCQL